MSDDRRPYRREPEGRRREALISAAVDLMAEGGIEAASVRAIADRAGVTPGLIRHYFRSKEDLTRAAFRQMMEDMTSESTAAAGEISDDPVAAVAAMVSASLRPPVMDGGRIQQWAMFLYLIRKDQQLGAVHEEAYLGFRNRLQAAIERLPGLNDPATARRLAIACNAVIDGLWLEGGTLPGSFERGEIEAIGLSAVSTLLGVTLRAQQESPPK